MAPKQQSSPTFNIYGSPVFNRNHAVRKSPRKPLATMRPAGLRPAGLRPLPRAELSIISISSTSPNSEIGDAPQVPRYFAAGQHNIPSGGILPTDSLQDVPLLSTEVPVSPAFFAPSNPNRVAGLAHYKLLTARYDKQYTDITTTFETYRKLPPPNVKLRRPSPELLPQILNLGPYVEGIDYNIIPQPNPEYTNPVYKATTYNPLIPLAILRLAAKNLPFMDFTSDETHLPNVGPYRQPPRFPTPEVRILDDAPHAITYNDELPFLEDWASTLPDNATSWPPTHDSDSDSDSDDESDDDAARLRRHQAWANTPGITPITVVFLPNYFLDGRHALAYITHKLASGRIASLVCAPCTTGELAQAGLLRVADPSTGMGAYRNPATKWGELLGWEDACVGWWEMQVGGGAEGRWFEREGYGFGEGEWQAWNRAVEDVGREWVVRAGISARVFEEDGREAAGRDGGKWGDARWD